LIIYGKESFGYIETYFTRANFLHLTGVNTKLSPGQFFNQCLNNALNTDDFEFRKDGTTALKLQMLPHILKPKQHYKMIGEYGGNKHFLQKDKLVGGAHACLGFVKSGNFYVPNTALQEDIRNITRGNARIVLILEKELSNAKYSEITYIAKNVDAAGVIKAINSDKIKLSE
jgi:hypothetical protein